MGYSYGLSELEFSCRLKQALCAESVVLWLTKEGEPGLPRLYKACSCVHDYSDQFDLPVERLLESQVVAAGSQSGQDEMIGIASISMAKHIGRMAGNASVGQIVGHVSSGRNVCSMGQGLVGISFARNEVINVVLR